MPQLITTSGSGTWTVPAWLTAGQTILVECWGAGSGASGRVGATFGAAGAGAAYAQSTYTLTPNDITNGVSYTVGAGSAGTSGANPSAGGATNFSTNNLNLIRNSTNIGAVVGSPGTFPTYGYWSPNFGTNPDFGITASIVAFGTDLATGFPYIDINLAGTTTSANSFSIYMENAAPASPALSYTYSAYICYNAGSLANITSVKLISDASTSAPVYISTPISQTITPTSTLILYSGTGTTPASTAILDAYFQIAFNSGVAINVTFRLAGVQLEQGATSTVFKSTPGYALAAGGGAPSGTTGGVGAATAASVGYNLLFAGGGGAAYNAAGAGGGGAGGKSGAGTAGNTSGQGGQGDATSGGTGGAVKTTTPGNPGTTNALGGGGGGGLTTVAGTGGAGGAPGGGGGAAVVATGTGGSGAAGQIQLTYLVSATVVINGSGSVTATPAGSVQTATLLIDGAAATSPAIQSSTVASTTMALSWAASVQPTVTVNAIHTPIATINSVTSKGYWASNFSKQFGRGQGGAVGSVSIGFTPLIVGAQCNIVATGSVSCSNFARLAAIETPTGIGTVTISNLIGNLASTATVSGVGFANAAANHTPNGNAIATGSGIATAFATHLPFGNPVVAGAGLAIVNAIRYVSDNPTLFGVGSVSVAAAILDTQPNIVINAVGSNIDNANHTPLALIQANGLGAVSSTGFLFGQTAIFINGISSVTATQGSFLPSFVTISIAGNVTVGSNLIAAANSILHGIGNTTASALLLDTQAIIIVSGTDTVAINSSHVPSGAVTINGNAGVSAVSMNVPPGQSIINSGGNVFINSGIVQVGAFVNIVAIGGEFIATNANAQSTISSASVGSVSAQAQKFLTTSALIAGSGALTGRVASTTFAVASIAGVVSSNATTSYVASAATGLAGSASIVINAIHLIADTPILVGTGSATSRTNIQSTAVVLISGVAAYSFSVSYGSSVFANASATANLAISTTLVESIIGTQLNGSGGVVINAIHIPQAAVTSSAIGVATAVTAQSYNTFASGNGGAQLVINTIHNPPANTEFDAVGFVAPIPSSLIMTATVLISGSSHMRLSYLINPESLEIIMAGAVEVFVEVNVIKALRPELPSASRIIKVGQSQSIRVPA